jgi:hypothetical protein
VRDTNLYPRYSAHGAAAPRVHLSRCPLSIDEDRLILSGEHGAEVLVQHAQPIFVPDEYRENGTCKGMAAGRVHDGSSPYNSDDVAVQDVRCIADVIVHLVSVLPCRCTLVSPGVDALR